MKMKETEELAMQDGTTPPKPSEMQRATGEWAFLFEKLKDDNKALEAKLAESSAMNSELAAMVKQEAREVGEWENKLTEAQRVIKDFREALRFYSGAHDNVYEVEVRGYDEDGVLRTIDDGTTASLSLAAHPALAEGKDYGGRDGRN